MFSLKWLMIIFLFILSGCITNPETGDQEIDWYSVNMELKLAIQDINDLKALAVNDPDMLDYMDKTVLALQAVQTGVEVYLSGGGDLNNIMESIDLALTITDEMVQNLSGSEELKTKVAIGVTAVRLVLRRIKAYAV